jgi:hypothetical protein
MTFGPNIDGQGIMAFANLQVVTEDRDIGNANEGEEVVAIKVERVEALVGEGGLNFDLDDVVDE